MRQIGTANKLIVKVVLTGYENGYGSEPVKKEELTIHELAIMAGFMKDLQEKEIQ
jgi:hypothetical protein